VRAQDCAQSLTRWAARDTMGQSLASFVETWGVQDDRTIRISLKAPFPLLIDALAKRLIPFTQVGLYIVFGLDQRHAIGLAAAWVRAFGNPCKDSPAR